MSARKKTKTPSFASLAFTADEYAAALVLTLQNELSTTRKRIAAAKKLIDMGWGRQPTS